ncbi:MAG: DUF1592 domain-containing protein [Rubripirellula sp.]
MTLNSLYRASVLVIGCLLAICTHAEGPSAVLEDGHRSMLKKHCFQCHNSETQEGQVNLADLSFDLATIESATLWQKVLTAINSGEMPPEGEKQLRAKKKTEFLADLSQSLVTARSILADSGGKITMRRLNRREYKNTIRDLVGVEMNVEDLPDDESAGGFDTAGASLFFSSDQFEKYMDIGRRAIQIAIDFKQSPKLLKEKREAEVAANKSVRRRHKSLKAAHERALAWKQTPEKSPKEFGFIDAARVEFEEGNYKKQFHGFDNYLKLPQTKTGVVLSVSQGGAYVDITQVPKNAPPGKYLLRVRAATLENAPERRCFLEYGVKEEGAPAGEMSIQGCVKISGTFENPSVVEIPIQLTATGSRQLGLRERQPNTRNAARSVFRKAQGSELGMPVPALWIDWVELTGPHSNGEANAYDRIFFRGKDAEPSDSYAREIIERFAAKAFRARSPSAGFVDRLLGIYQGQRKTADSFEAALKDPLAIVLAAPGFLYLREPGLDAEQRQLSDMELAIRLSYFLWSSPPDEELIRLANSGELRDPQELAAQTDRLLASERSWEFISGFTHQWLQMDRLEFFQFNHTAYGEFDDSVKGAARQEVYHMIETVLQEDLSMGTLLDSDFVVINDLLANYYGIEGVVGNEFRKVPVDEDSPRGGLLGTAAVLAMGSDGERSSPVERGAWVMRKLLNDPPPPAPANVPQLSRLEDQALSARELQSAHMEEPQCAQCHRNIDPLGFGLQNFDAAGKWRTSVLVAKSQASSKGKAKPKGKNAKVSLEIDSSGTFPDGEPFKDYFQLREKLGNRVEAFSRGFSESLISYGLGRPFGFTDEDLAVNMMDHASQKEYSMRAFIHALVQSPQFKRK